MKRYPHLRWIWALWKERKGLIGILFLLTLTSSAVAVAMPYLSKLILDTVQAALGDPAGHPDPQGELRRVLLVLVALGAGGFAASLFPGVRGAMNAVFEHIIRKKYFARIMDKDWSFFAKYRTGDVVTRLTDDLYEWPRLAWFLCSGIFRAVESVSKILFCIIAMLLLSPALTFWTLLPLPAMLWAFYKLQDRIYDSAKRNQEAVSDINSQLELSFSGARVVKAFACEGRYGRFFDGALGKRYGTELAMARLDNLLRLIFQNIDYFGQVGVIVAGGLMAVSGAVSVGTFYAFYTYLAMLVGPFLDIPQLLVSGKKAFVNIDRLEEMAEHPDPRPAGNAKPGRFERLELRGVSFRYPGREADALSGLDLSVSRGERVLVMGPVGSGKSVLARMAAGLLEPREGEVLWNGAPLGDLDPAALAARRGYVPQESLLFSGSLRENVLLPLLGDDEEGAGKGDELREERLRLALSAARMEEEVASFPDGADAELGQRGANVSGGQRQRLAAARALAGLPELLVLDDVTASLDAANEERMMRALAGLNEGMAVIAVSHRLSSLRYADKVVYVEEGRVVASGSPAEIRRVPSFAAFAAAHKDE